MSLFLSGILILFSNFVWADKIYVETPTEEVSPDVPSSTVRELVAAAVTELGHELVDSPSSAQYRLRPKLLRLAETHVLVVEKWHEGKVTKSSQLKAVEPKEFDTIAKRVVRAVLSSEISKTNARVDEVTSDEMVADKRRRLNRSGSIASAGLASLNNFKTTGLALLRYVAIIETAFADTPSVLMIRLVTSF